MNKKIKNPPAKLIIFLFFLNTYWQMKNFVVKSYYKITERRKIRIGRERNTIYPRIYARKEF